MDARPTRGRHRIATAVAEAERSPKHPRRDAARTPELAGRPAGDRRGRRRPAALGALVVAGLVASCSTGTEAGPDSTSPTFVRADGAALAFEEPVSNVADLVAPRAEEEPWTIVGSVFDPEAGAAEATVWTADDGSDWERTTVEPADRGTGESMVAATHTADGMVAVGQIGNGAEGDAAIWHRADDGEWQLARPDALGGDHEQWAFDVVSGDGGILVAGGEIVWGELRPRLWFSADGESWASVDGGAGGPLDETGEESVRDVAAVGDGFVAVGSRTIDNEQDGLAWYSADGETWEPLDTPTLGGPQRQDVLTVAATEAGVVAGGYVSDDSGLGQPVVWRSADGRTWGDPAASLPLRDEGRKSASSDLGVRSITVAPDGLVAAGGDEWRPHIWTSPDGGVTWSDTGSPIHGGLFEDGVNLRDAERFGDLTVAVGTEPSVIKLAGSRWQDATGDSFPAGGEQPFATSVASGHDTAIAVGGLHTAPAGEVRETYKGQVWRAAGDGWEAVDSEHLAAGQIMDVAAFGAGFVAVGHEDRALADRRGDIVLDPEPDGLVWVSPNGTDWARIGVQDARINEANLQFLLDTSPENALVLAEMETETPPESAPPAGGAGTRSLSAVAPLDEGFIAVGSLYDGTDAEPIIVASADGLEFFGEDVPHTGPGIQRYHDVCVGPDGTAVAVGVSGTPRAFDVIVAARDAATGKWQAAEGPFDGGGAQEGYGCAAGEDGFVVVGADDSSGNVDARVWTSADGVTWTEVESGLLGGTGDQWASAVAPAPEGGWLVGGTDTSTGDGDIALWRVTADGDMSRRDRDEPALTGPGDQSVSNISIDDDGRVTITGNDYGRVGLWESDTLDR